MASWTAGTVTPPPSVVAAYSARPSTVPSASPTSVPNVDTITDSRRSTARVWRRVWPTARSRPISRRRSYTASDSVLAMPSRAMTIASASRA